MVLLLLAVLLHSAGTAGVDVSAAPRCCLLLLSFVPPDLLRSEDCLLESRDDGSEGLQLARLSH